MRGLLLIEIYIYIAFFPADYDMQVTEKEEKGGRFVVALKAERQKVVFVFGDRRIKDDFIARIVPPFFHFPLFFSLGFLFPLSFLVVLLFPLFLSSHLPSLLLPRVPLPPVSLPLHLFTFLSDPSDDISIE